MHNKGAVYCYRRSSVVCPWLVTTVTPATSSLSGVCANNSFWTTWFYLDVRLVCSSWHYLCRVRKGLSYFKVTRRKMRPRVGLSSLYEEMNKFITHIERRLTITERPHFPVHQYHCCRQLLVFLSDLPVLLFSIVLMYTLCPKKRPPFYFFE